MQCHGGMKTITTKETVDKYMTPCPHTVGKDQSLAKAHELMREHGIRHLPVLDGGRLVGLLSDRDVHLVQSLRDVVSAQVPVEQAMSYDPYCVTPLTELEQVAREMARKKLGSAVVMEGPKVVGIFTAIDALETLAWMLERGADAPPVKRHAKA